ncbi:MAG: enoyl-CoA hydratase [Jatrophihabitans sp.]|nr:MAG: enoyl-CoA hydratase [Jatrophihabitans sp.]
MTRLEADPDIWVCVLTGAGDGAFCAGVDLKEAAQGLAAGFETADGGLAGFVRAPRTKVWIAAAQSHALGGGLELVLACDLAVASESATFSLPEVGWGLIAGGGGVVRLPRTVPRRIAFQMIATAQPISALDAHRFGLVNAVAPAEQVRETALALARQVCANSPAAVRESLAVARRAAGDDESELWAMVAAATRTLSTGPDFAEGPRAFSEKRPPRWVG